MTNSPQFDFVFAQRRAFARAKAREIYDGMTEYAQRDEYYIALKLEEALREYEKGLEKMVDQAFKLVDDWQARSLNPIVIRKPTAEEKYAELT